MAWGSSLGRSVWAGGEGGRPNSTSSGGSGGSWNSSSTWLILKNLTPQIDGSTLKTLCMQHGPLANFHLALNQGFALVSYGTKDEAAKVRGVVMVLLTNFFLNHLHSSS